MNSLHIRPYRPEDWTRVAAIHDGARMQELRLAGLEAAFLPLEIAAEREGLFDYSVAVAERDGQPLGFAAWEEGELAWLYVDPPAMRQGIGAQLLDYVLARTGRPMSIEVLAGNTPALGLYQSRGFRVVDTQRGSMPGNEEFQVEVHVLELDAVP